MNTPAIPSFGPDPLPAPQGARDSGSSGAGDLFGDLLRGQMNAPAPSSKPSHADAAERPQPDNSTNDSNETRDPPPAADDSKPAAETSDAKKPADSSAKKDSKSGDADGAKDKKDDSKPADNAAGQAAPANAVAAAVVTVLAQAAPSASGDDSGTATAAKGTDGVAAVGASGAANGQAQQAQAAPPQAPGVAPEPPAPNPDETPNGSKDGNAPFQAQVTVTDESKTMVSRPSAALAPAHAADLAAENKKAQDSSDDKDADTPEPQPGKAAAATTTSDKPADKTDHAAAAHANAAAAPAGDAGHGGAKPDATPQPQVQANTNTAPMPAHASAPQTDAGTQMPAVATAARPTAAAVPTPATFNDVAVQITKAATDGLEKISIQLKPESLGRIDVQLQVAHDGRVNANIAVHRQDTLDLLQRDARTLERALQDAGLRTDSGSLNFNLSGQGRDNMPGGYVPAASNPASVGTETDLPLTPSPAAVAYDQAASRGGVDIRV